MVQPFFFTIFFIPLSGLWQTFYLLLRFDVNIGASLTLYYVCDWSLWSTMMSKNPESEARASPSSDSGKRPFSELFQNKKFEPGRSDRRIRRAKNNPIHFHHLFLKKCRAQVHDGNDEMKRFIMDIIRSSFLFFFKTIQTKSHGVMLLISLYLFIHTLFAIKIAPNIWINRTWLSGRMWHPQKQGLVHRPRSTESGASASAQFNPAVKPDWIQASQALLVRWGSGVRGGTDASASCSVSVQSIRNTKNIYASLHRWSWVTNCFQCIP